MNSLPAEIIENIGSHIISIIDFISFMICNKKNNIILQREYKERLSLINTPIHCILITSKGTYREKHKDMINGLSFYINIDSDDLNEKMDELMNSYIERNGDITKYFWYKIRIYPNTLPIMKNNLSSLKILDGNFKCAFDSYDKIYLYLKSKNNFNKENLYYDYNLSIYHCFLFIGEKINLILKEPYIFNIKCPYSNFNYGGLKDNFVNVEIGSSSSKNTTLPYYNGHGNYGVII